MKTPIQGVDVTYWNPRTRRLRGLPLAPRMNNFGDVLGPWIVRKLLGHESGLSARATRRDLITAGTIMYMAPDRATVWGTGTRDTVSPDRYMFRELDVRAVRGPMTRALLSERGIEAPEVYGDPGLLVPLLEPSLVNIEKHHDVVYVPNYADLQTWQSLGLNPLINPRAPLDHVLKAIASSRAVVASSLHALILADAFGIPSVRVVSGVEGDFKYHDYALGAGRIVHTPAPTPVGALDALESAPTSVDTAPLLDAFPRDLWLASTDTAR